MRFNHRPRIPKRVRRAALKIPEVWRLAHYVHHRGVPRPRKLDGGRFLVATKRGLYLLSKSGLYPIADGEYYGLTGSGDRWLAFQKKDGAGRVLRFSLNGYTRALTPLEGILSPGCHQIDFIGDELYIADTYHNAILVCSPDHRHLNPRARYHPAGELASGRGSDNYVHLNSLWRGPAGLMALFHNETRKTGRPSEVVTLNPDLTIAERRATTAENGHNILIYRGRPLYCDSGGGGLMWGDAMVFKPNWFTRGLSIIGARILVGGSAYGDQADRQQLPGVVWVLDSDFRLLEHIDMPGMVQEIRCVNQRDFGMSRPEP